MWAKRVVETLNRQAWIDTISKKTQQVVKRAFGSDDTTIANVLHGTGSGHPLHPALTDIPIGAWSTALVLDTLDTLNGDDRYAPAAEVAISYGLIGAVGAALTGVTDWKELSDRPRRIGWLHGVLNGTATMLYGGSLLLRKQQAHTAGRLVGLAGFSLAGVAAFLGGDLVYRERIGPSHAAPIDGERTWTAVLAADELADNTPTRVQADQRTLVLVRQNGQINALDARCSHMGGPLDEGTLEGHCLRCPWHGSVFDLQTGNPVEGPATVVQPHFATRIRDGQIEVLLDSNV